MQSLLQVNLTMNCSALRSIPITGTSSLLWPRLTSCSSLLLRFSACKTSRDKSYVFPRLPARFTHQGYGCLLDFAADSQLVRLMCLGIGFLSVRPRLRYCFFSPAPHDANLANRYRVRRQLRPLGLSPQTYDMPVILIRLGKQCFPNSEAFLHQAQEGNFI